MDQLSALDPFVVLSEGRAFTRTVDRLRKQQVQRARYEAEQAQLRYMRVDPNNRLVADTLEADWNSKLRALRRAQDAYEEHSRSDQQKVRNNASVWSVWPPIFPSCGKLRPRPTKTASAWLD